MMRCMRRDRAFDMKEIKSPFDFISLERLKGTIEELELVEALLLKKLSLEKLHPAA
jgi:hypothetical protein